MRTALLLVGASLLAGWPLACSSGDTSSETSTTTTGSSTSTGTATGTTTGTGSGGGDGGAGATCNFSLGTGGSDCDAPGYSPAEEDRDVGVVTADVLDLEGAAAAQISSEICGLNICLVADQADAAGHVLLDGGNGTAVNPVMLFGNGVDFVQFFAPLPDGTDPAIGTIHAARLPPFADGAPLVVGGPATSGGITLTLAADAYLEFDVFKFCAPGEQVFRAVEIPLDEGFVLPMVDESMDFGVMVGLAPMDATICPPAMLTVPNVAGWAADAPVELYLAGTSVMQDYAPYGGWGKLSDGAVSSNGQTVSTLPTGGIGVLGTIAIRLTPGG